MPSPILRFRRFLMDRMVLRPSRHAIDYGSQKPITLSILDDVVECFVHSPFSLGDDGCGDQKPDLLVLKFPGTGGRAERSTPFPATMVSPDQFSSVEVWTWNPPGYGNSGGRATLQGMADSAIEFARQVIRKRSAESTVLWLTGNSLGCASALWVASEIEMQLSDGPTNGSPPNDLPVNGTADAIPFRAAGLLLRNPPPLDLIVKRIARRYPLGRLMEPVADSLPASMKAIETASLVQLPALFLRSELDSLVVDEHQSAIHQAYGGPSKVVLLEGIGHDGIADETHEPLIREGIDWLIQTGRTINV